MLISSVLFLCLSWAAMSNHSHVFSGRPHASRCCDVTTYGASGNGVRDDTHAINSAIAALTPGSELYFPCGTYLVSSALTPITVQNVSVAGAPGCVTIHGTGSGYKMMQIGTNNLTSPTPLLAASAELSTTLQAAFANLGGLAAGDFVLLQEGGKDYSTDTAPGHDTNCDISGCRGEVLQIQNVSGTVATVTTALHYPYDPLANAAMVAKIANPLQGISVSNLTFDGSGTVSTGLYLVGVVNSTVSNVTVQNVVGWGLASFYAYNLAWNNVAVSHAGNGNNNAFLLWGQGRPSINGATLSNLNSTAFGLGLSTVTDGTFTNVTIDKAGTTSGRPFKTIAASYNTFTGLTVRNGIGSGGYNGMSLEYYSSHNTFSGCVVTNNSRSGGIIGFGNYNQYNKFVNCTVSGNSGWQLGQGASALGQYNDTHWEISGGTYTGTSGNSVIQLNSPNGYVHNATVNAPGDNGIFVGGNSGCVNSNRFTGAFAYYSIYFGGTADLANGNIDATRSRPNPLPTGRCP